MGVLADGLEEFMAQPIEEVDCDGKCDRCDERDTCAANNCEDEDWLEL